MLLGLGLCAAVIAISFGVNREFAAILYLAEIFLIMGWAQA